MILLDTNVLSEGVKRSPDRRVIDWMDAQPFGTTWICSISVGEIELGLALHPDGKKRAELEALYERALAQFEAYCVSYDVLAARHYATIRSARRLVGRPISIQDAQIAAIAKSAGFTLATRNVKDFEGIDGLKLTNPWV